MTRTILTFFLLFSLSFCANAQEAGKYVRPPKGTPESTSKSNPKSSDKSNTSRNHGSKGSSKPKQTCPDGNHPHMIDLGLPSGTKWACCNVGASKPEDDGGYYAWGETTTKSDYSWSTYKHCDGDSNSCHDLGKSVCGTQYDVAHVKWGGSWQMPSRAQQDELRQNCTYTWTTVNGVKGGKFTGPNGRSIFLPASGDRNGTDLYNRGEYGLYWSGTQYASYDFSACYLYFYSIRADWSCYDRRGGLLVRPVAE